MTFIEAINSFEVSNLDKNKLLALLIKNHPYYYKYHASTYDIKFYEIGVWTSFRKCIDLILSTNDLTVANLCVKSIQNDEKFIEHINALMKKHKNI